MHWGSSTKPIRNPPWWFGLAIFILLPAGVGLMAADLGSGQATAADWISALATLAGVIAALLAGWYVAQAYVLETQREEARDQASVRAQAEQIAAWYGGSIDIWISNSSPLPVYDVVLTITTPTLGVLNETDAISLLPPQEPQSIRRLLGETTVRALEGWARAVELGQQPNRPWPMVAVRFRDAAGRPWVRAEDGSLLETADR